MVDAAPEYSEISSIASDSDFDVESARHQVLLSELNQGVLDLSELDPDEVLKMVKGSSKSVQEKKVIEAAAIILGLAPVKSTKGRQFVVVSHKAAQQVASQPNFIQRLLSHTATGAQIPEDQLKALTTYITNPLLEGNQVQEVSPTAGVIWRWILATYAQQVGKSYGNIIHAHRRRSKRSLNRRRLSQRAIREMNLGLAPSSPRAARQSESEFSDNEMSVTESTLGALTQGHRHAARSLDVNNKIRVMKSAGRYINGHDENPPEDSSVLSVGSEVVSLQDGEMSLGVSEPYSPMASDGGRPSQSVDDSNVGKPKKRKKRVIKRKKKKVPMSARTASALRVAHKSPNTVRAQRARAQTARNNRRSAKEKKKKTRNGRTRSATEDTNGSAERSRESSFDNMGAFYRQADELDRQLQLNLDMAETMLVTSDSDRSSRASLRSGRRSRRYRSLTARGYRSSRSDGIDEPKSKFMSDMTLRSDTAKNDQKLGEEVSEFLKRVAKERQRELQKKKVPHYLSSTSLLEIRSGKKQFKGSGWSSVGSLGATRLNSTFARTKSLANTPQSLIKQMREIDKTKALTSEKVQELAERLARPKQVVEPPEPVEPIVKPKSNVDVKEVTSRLYPQIDPSQLPSLQERRRKKENDDRASWLYDSQVVDVLPDISEETPLPPKKERKKVNIDELTSRLYSPSKISSRVDLTSPDNVGELEPGAGGEQMPDKFRHRKTKSRAEIQALTERLSQPKVRVSDSPTNDEKQQRRNIKTKEEIRALISRLAQPKHALDEPDGSGRSRTSSSSSRSSIRSARSPTRSRRSSSHYEARSPRRSRALSPRSVR